MRRPPAFIARVHDDRGSASLGLAIYAPALIALICLVIAAGRIQDAQQAADAAARAAARSASISHNPAGAQDEARAAALNSLNESGLHCSQVSVTVDAGGLSAPIGQAATVTASVSCTAPLEDITLPGVPMPGSKTMTGHQTSVVDQWAARTGNGS